MAFGFKLNPNGASRIRQKVARRSQEAIKTINAALVETAGLIKERGDQNIQRSGQFSARWTNGFKVTVSKGHILMSHDQIGARLFEYGGQVKGRPFLPIPLSFSDARGKRAKDYPGGLFRVDRDGKRPLLLSIRDKKPKYVLVSRIRMPRKWRLRDIAQYAIKNNFPKFLRKKR